MAVRAWRSLSLNPLLRKWKAAALRLAKQWNILSDQNLARIDCIYGWQAYRPEWIVRILGA